MEISFKIGDRVKITATQGTDDTRYIFTAHGLETGTVLTCMEHSENPTYSFFQGPGRRIYDIYHRHLSLMSTMEIDDDGNII